MKEKSRDITYINSLSLSSNRETNGVWSIMKVIELWENTVFKVFWFFYKPVTYFEKRIVPCAVVWVSLNEATWLCCRSAHCGEAGGQRDIIEGEGREEEGRINVLFHRLPAFSIVDTVCKCAQNTRGPNTRYWGHRLTDHSKLPLQECIILPNTTQWTYMFLKRMYEWLKSGLCLALL